MKIYPFNLENLEGELWKNIDGYEKRYQISTFGRVKSFFRGKTKILEPFVDKDGYLQIALSKNGRVKKFKIHRLVSKAFIPNVEDKPQIRRCFHKRLSKV